MSVVGSIVFLFAAPGLLGVFIPWYTTGWHMDPPLLGFEPVRWLGRLLILFGAAVLLDSFARFALQGRGTPAPIYPTRRWWSRAPTATCATRCTSRSSS